MIERIVKYSKYIALAMIILNALFLAGTVVYFSLVATTVIKTSIAYLIIAVIVIAIDVAVSVGAGVIAKIKKF